MVYDTLTYALVVGVETALALLLFALLGLAYLDRQSGSYLWLWVASGTLVLRALVGLLPFVAEMNPGYHAAIDQGLDIVLIVAVLLAVYSARRIEGTPTHD